MARATSEPRRRRLRAVAALSTTLSLALCSPRTAPRGPRGYALVSIDTLRADRLGYHGYPHFTTPHLDALSRRATAFENATAHYHGTLPSHMSIFTGLYPSQHGVLPPHDVLSREIATLPELLKRAGFRTAGHGEGGNVDGAFGFSRGFDEWSDEAAHSESDVEKTRERATAFLDGLAPGERFFLFVHTYAVHAPYRPPPHHGRMHFAGSVPADVDPHGPELQRYVEHWELPSAAALAYYGAAYDGSIGYADHEMGRLLAHLRRRSLAKETLVVVTSDHGEEFGEHGRLLHTQPYPELLHVPLIVSHPSVGRGTVPSTLARSIDIAPTIYDLAGVETERALPGRSLLPILLGAAAPSATESLAEGNGPATRVLIRQEAGAMHQLLVKRVGGNWIGSPAAVDVVPSRGTAKLALVAFHVPRKLRIEEAGRTLAEVEIPTRPTTIEVPVEGSGRHRLQLVADSCDVPERLGGSRDRRCLSVRLMDASTQEVELYALDGDPGAIHDLGLHEQGRADELLTTLENDWPPLVAQPGTRLLTPALRKRLETLGYVN